MVMAVGAAEVGEVAFNLYMLPNAVFTADPFPAFMKWNNFNIRHKSFFELNHGALC